MGLFPDREAAFENRFAHDEEVAFLVRMGRDRRFGLWAAERLGLDAEAGEAYARALVRRALAGAGDAELTAEVERDLANAGFPAPTPVVAQALAEAEAQSRARLMDGAS